MYWSPGQIEDVPPGDDTMTSTIVPLVRAGAIAVMELSLPTEKATLAPPIVTEVAPLKYCPDIATEPIGPLACVTTGAG